MNGIKYNKSKTYLLPLLSELVGFDKKFFNSLLNVYMFDDLGKYENCLYILHDFSFKNPDFTAYEHRFINNNLFQELIDIDDKVLYIFKLPEEYLHEYRCLKDGKYSEYKDDAKEMILDFFTDVYKYNPNAVPFLIKVRQILFKDDKLKKEIERNLGIELDNDAELTDHIALEDETFKLSKYINNESKNKEVTSKL